MKSRNKNGTSLDMPLELWCHTRSGWSKGKLTLFAVIAVILMASVVLVACRSQSPEAPLSEGEGLVAAGKDIFANRCARCHGARGQGGFGPTIVGDGALAKYENAQALFEVVSVAMPFDAPGTLSREQYLQVVSFLITENAYTTPKEIEPGNLADISLVK